MEAKDPQDPLEITRPMLPISVVMENLKKPIPKKFIKTLQDASKAQYVPWARISQLIDHYANGYYDFSIESASHEDRAVVTATIRIRGLADNGFDVVEITRSDIGSEKLSKDSYGDPWTSAVSQAFRRAAARFGLGIALWLKE